MDSNSRNMNVNSVVIAHDSLFSENEQISTETGTAEIAKAFSSKILNAGFINDIGKFVGTFMDDLTKKTISNFYGTIFGLSTQLEFISEVELWQSKCFRMNKDGGGVKSLASLIK
ncbi:hypothetical protein HELRODRAFT_167005 [Helobdella robusta]|uniref:Uncharacterized protein n=1 Tax=Helobdella robusta TaxID=6412 RepID=T1EYV9_HELRO|nr:hypothetical protein HELRODRAFT_167005 [Helobdella robusta]ESO11912.1 hypothetical protein HELRODRAFT_167005 [Helobdella robusta]